MIATLRGISVRSSIKSILIFSLAVLILSGCSVFKSSYRMDTAPFADNTRTLFAEAIKMERPFPWKLLRDKTMMQEYQEASNRAKPIIEVFHGIIYYSNQVVAIYNSKLSPKSKAHMLADYLDEGMQKALKKENTDSLSLDLPRAREILAEIRNAETYFKALAAAEPIINAVVSATMERIDELQELIPPILSGFTRDIEHDFAAAKENYRRLRDLQEKTMLSMTRLYYVRLGDHAELLKLLDEDPSLKHFIPSEDQANYENMMKAENYLLNQVKEIELMINHLDDIKEEYIAKYDELLGWKKEFDDKILIARTSLTIWARAHKNLGAGVPVPPLIDVEGITGSLAGKATKVIIP